MHSNNNYGTHTVCYSRVSLNLSQTNFARKLLRFETFRKIEFPLFFSIGVGFSLKMSTLFRNVDRIRIHGRNDLLPISDLLTIVIVPPPVRAAHQSARKVAFRGFYFSINVCCTVVTAIGKVMIRLTRSN